ncbi:MAG: hypothetical protein DUW69_002320, partial [Verrucomicrobia bacterium]
AMAASLQANRVMNVARDTDQRRWVMGFGMPASVGTQGRHLDEG